MVIYNYMLQSLVTQFETTSQYWNQINPPYEVDFLIQRGNDIFPVEVKADTNFGGKSLQNSRSCSLIR